MAGCARANTVATERAILTAWYAERFAREKKLRRLSHYLAETRPKKPQTGDEVLALMRGFHAAGIPMTITRVKGGKDGG